MAERKATISSRLVDSISVRIAGYPIAPVVSAAFYQAEDEALSTPLMHDTPGAFYSALDSETLSLQCDKSGRLLFIQVNKPRRLWVGEHGISAAPSPFADLRFLDFRAQVPEPEYLCDARRDNLLIRFGDVYSADSFQIGDNVFAFIHKGAILRGLYIDMIQDDRAGKLMSRWRKAITEGPESPSET